MEMKHSTNNGSAAFLSFFLIFFLSFFSDQGSKLAGLIDVPDVPPSKAAVCISGERATASAGARNRRRRECARKIERERETERMNGERNRRREERAPLP